MSAEAIARLREARPVFRAQDRAVVKLADLRALLDEREALLEALDQVLALSPHFAIAVVCNAAIAKARGE